MTHSHTPKYLNYSFQTSRLIFQDNPREKLSTTPVATAPETPNPSADAVKDKHLETLPEKKGVDKKISMAEYISRTPHAPSFKMTTTNQPTDVQTYDKEGKLIGAHANVESVTEIRGLKGLSILHTVPPPKWEFQINGKT